MNFREKYDNLPRRKQREIRRLIIEALDYQAPSSFYALLNGSVKNLTVNQKRAVDEAFLHIGESSPYIAIV